MTMTAKKHLYIGCNSNLISGEAYSFKELSQATGVSDQSIRNRMKSSLHAFVNDDLLVKPQSGSVKIQPKKMKVELSISQLWLSINLVSRI